MRLLLIHVESFWYEAKIKTPIAVEIPEDLMARNFGEAVIALYSTEAADDEDPSQVARLAADEIRAYLAKVGPKKLILFAFAFLVGRDEKSSSSTAAGMEKLLLEELKMSGVEVVPFGWYKKFSITSMGHKYSVHSARVIPTKADN